MGISIKNEHTEQLARELARETGESLTTAITRALEERLARLEGRRSPAQKLAEARAVLRRLDTLPVLDGRRTEDIIGYDEHGLPGAPR
jgi:antitoxin VapB